MKLEQEAKSFMDENYERKNLTSAQKTAMRFYFGNAVGGYISAGSLTSVGRLNEILEAAENVAKAALKKESDW